MSIKIDSRNKAVIARARKMMKQIPPAKLKQRIKVNNRDVSFAELQVLADINFYGLNIRDVSSLDNIHIPLLIRSKEDKTKPEKEILRYMRNPDYFAFLCKEVFNIELLPFQALVLKQLYTHKFPMLIGSRGFSKTFLLALYAWIVIFINQGSKVALIGSGYRQSKILFEYMERIWQNSPVLRSIAETCSHRCGPKKEPDKWSMTFGNSIAFALPIGDGTKIRGLRATHLICDEFASQNKNIYETVVQGFAAVSANPVLNVKENAKQEFFKSIGLKTEQDKEQVSKGNQTILSGTAYYSFNHFYEYFERYRNIIKSKGDKNKLREVFKNGVPASFNWKDYCIIRVPYNHLPPGFMDADQIARSQAMIEESQFQREFLTIFTNDSNGFFKRSAVEGATTEDYINTPISGLVKFSPSSQGRIGCKYVFGIDPASESDHFSVVILEIHPDHRRVVYCWTTNKDKFNVQSKTAQLKEKNYFAFCARKIRDLISVFPPELIVMDAMGGGYQTLEALHDTDKLSVGETPIWPLYSNHPLGSSKYAEYDDQSGQHIVLLYQARDIEMNTQAHYGLKKDIVDKYLLFPGFDYVEAASEFELRSMLAESDPRLQIEITEDIYEEIQEMKNELCNIVVTNTGANGFEKFDTPDKKADAQVQRKGAMKKDRFSALLMANYGARQLIRDLTVDLNQKMNTGGFSSQNMYSLLANGDQRKYVAAPDWFLKGLGY